MIANGIHMPQDGRVRAKNYDNVAGLSRSEAQASKSNEELHLIKEESGVGDCNLMDKDNSGVTFWGIFAQAFTVTFLGEWGDRSQFATVVLTWNGSKGGIIVGCIASHCVTTGLAVIGGRMIAHKISPKIVSLVGGVVFIGFSFITLFKNNDIDFF